MIPQRMLSNESEIFGNGNGLKDRVTACRKRLRLNRIHRAHVDNQLEGLLREPIGASECRGYSGDDSAVRESFVDARVHARVQARDSEASPRVDEQEVGIT